MTRLVQMIKMVRHLYILIAITTYTITIYLATSKNEKHVKLSTVMKLFDKLKVYKLGLIYVPIDLTTYVLYIFYLERGNCTVNASSRWILEAKFRSYKLYTQSFLSLLMSNGCVSDEVSAMLHA